MVIISTYIYIYISNYVTTYNHEYYPYVIYCSFCSFKWIFILSDSSARIWCSHAAKHTHHIERVLKTTPRLRLSLTQWLFMPNLQTTIFPTAAILRALRNHPAQNIRPLLKPLHFQHSCLYRAQRPNRDPDHDNPQ